MNSKNDKKKILIFLGPSLPLSDAKKILPHAEYRSPIRRGDLDKIKKPSGYIVGMIDGIFHHSLAVSVVEVRTFLEKGGIVYGASSMGALRAVELKPLGMIGVGQIYKDFLSGKLNSDEDVALTLNPETGAAMTIPTVQVKYAVALAKKAKKISEASARKALMASRKIFYAERTFQMLSHSWKAVLPEKERLVLEKILKDPKEDPKRRDAVELLGVLGKDA